MCNMSKQEEMRFFVKEAKKLRGVSTATSVTHSTSADSNYHHQFWDYPKLTNIISQLQHEFRHYKYTLYRCAAKFVTLQKVFFTNNVPYKLILAVMERHGILECDVNLMVPPFQLTSLIHDIYYACEKLGHFSDILDYSLESATTLLANFFWNIYDPHRRHSISLIEIKMTFLLLCKLYPNDNYILETYKAVSSRKTKCVSKLNFEYMLNTLVKLWTYIGEGTGYGTHNISIVMEQCFARCHNVSGLTDYDFHYLWTTKQTRFLIYANLIALIKRIEDTEKLIHYNTCASCHCVTIVGIRFKCQSCSDISLCLKCFATGYQSNKHNVSHRMCEMFSEDLPPKKLSHYLSKLCTILCFAKTNEESRGFCDTNESITCNNTELITIKANGSSSASTLNIDAINSTNALKSVNNKTQFELAKGKNETVNASLTLATTTSNALNVSERLQIIIDKLLLQNSKLEQQLNCIQTSTPEEISKFLSAHQKFLMEIINEMRSFSQTSPSTMQSSTRLYPSASTPNHSVFATTELGNFSAISERKINGSNNKVGGKVEDLNNLKDNLTCSIHGADINRSYLDANRSDYSLNDLSSWFNQKRLSSLPSSLSAVPEVNSTQVSLCDYKSDNALMLHSRDTDMTNFKLLLNKVKEIVDDSYSDNTELSAATQNLENVLDSIIKSEESRRHYSRIENV
uniref:ZZ-type domain-containing protein n=1 Tax=Glossina brevipalpis TaxID=37001 RepID=A0A1A9WCB7_9MUSC